MSESRVRDIEDEVRTLDDEEARRERETYEGATAGVSHGTLGHDTVGVTPTGEVGEGSASGDLSGGAPPGIEDTGATAGAESLRDAAGQE
ncbi:MAG TPA: hypothetical protein VFU47_16140 [Armatimonadota bacterium]|nr:hypothetical protein [Armatimonadota bacterium]